MKHRPIHGLVALSVIALAACTDAAGPDGRDSLESLLTLDVAMVSADALLEDVAELQLIFFGGFAAPAEGPRDRVRTVTFYDADGNEQDGYDAETTASAHIVSEISGEMSRENWSGTVSRTRDMTITGLVGDETTRTANGTGSGTMSRSRHSDEDGDRTYEMTGASVITDVVRGLPREDNPYPLSGSITRDVTVVIVNGPNGDETRTRDVLMVFNGTQFATMTVGDETFEVDLSTRDGRHPFRRRDG